MQIWDVLKNRKGRECAITAKNLASITSINERVVRREVATLRRKGYPIASATTKPYGFYIPANRNEIRECQAQLRSRMKEIRETSEALDQAFNDYLPSEHQTLDLFSSDGV